jgi:hypothetical protein
MQWVAGRLRIKGPEHEVDHLYIMPRLRLSGARIPVPLPAPHLPAFMAYTGTTLPSGIPTFRKMQKLLLLHLLLVQEELVI